MSVDWPAIPLGELCDVLDNMRKPVTKRDRTSGRYPYYGATGVQDHVADYIFDEPLVLVGEDGAKWQSGDNTAFAVDGKCWVNNHAHVLRPIRERLVDNWLVYYLNHSDLSEFVSGLTVPKLNQGNLREIAIPCPPLPEQQRIVRILDEAFDCIATAKANAEKNLQNARALFETYLQAFFTRRGEGWVETRLADVCKEITVGHVGSMAKQYRDGGIPFLRSQNIRPFRVTLENTVFIDGAFHSALAKSQLRPGDVAIVRTGYPGTAAVIPDTLKVANCSDLVIVRPDGQVDSYYLEAFFNSQFGKDLVSGQLVGAAQKHFNITAAKELLIHLPSMPVQRSAVLAITNLRSETQRLEAIYERKLASLGALKKSLLDQAFSGAL